MGQSYFLAWVLAEVWMTRLAWTPVLEAKDPPVTAGRAWIGRLELRERARSDSRFNQPRSLLMSDLPWGTRCDLRKREGSPKVPGNVTDP